MTVKGGGIQQAQVTLQGDSWGNQHPLPAPIPPSSDFLEEFDLLIKQKAEVIRSIYVNYQFSSFLVSELYYTLKNYGGPQRTSVSIAYIH